MTLKATNPFIRALSDTQITQIIEIRDGYPYFEVMDTEFKYNGVLFKIKEHPYEIFITNKQIENYVKNENSYTIKTENGELEFFFYKLFV